MLNQTGIKNQSYGTRKTILVDEMNSTAFSVVVSSAGVTADSKGRKIIKAGTPLSGSLTARNVAFTVASVSGATYTKTTDESIQSGKTYYTRSGSGEPYTYTPVEEPEVGSISSYYEKTVNGTSNAIGLAHHDVDVTSGTANSGVIVFGFIDVSKLDSDVALMITDEVKSALKMVQFVK